MTKLLAATIQFINRTSRPGGVYFSCSLVFHSICDSHINSVALDLSTQYHGLSLKISTFPSLE